MVILPLFFFHQLFHFSTYFFFRSDYLWVELLLEFSTDHFETMHTYSTWSIDVHVVLGLSFLYFLSVFFSSFKTYVFPGLISIRIDTLS